MTSQFYSESYKAFVEITVWPLDLWQNKVCAFMVIFDQQKLIRSTLRVCMCQIWMNSLKLLLSYHTHKNRMDGLDKQTTKRPCCHFWRMAASLHCGSGSDCHYKINMQMSFFQKLSDKLTYLVFPELLSSTVRPVVSILWMTRWSNTIFFFALSMMSSSTVPLVTSRYIFTCTGRAQVFLYIYLSHKYDESHGLEPWITCFFWPILCALACACRSFWGFQSESKMTTVSAEAKLIPKPPALVDNRKQKSYKNRCKQLLHM